MNWLRHSGLDVHIKLNPFQWRWMPRLYKSNSQEWPDCMFRSYCANWLFLGVNLWIDDGSW